MPSVLMTQIQPGAGNDSSGGPGPYWHRGASASAHSSASDLLLCPIPMGFLRIETRWPRRQFEFGEIGLIGKKPVEGYQSLVTCVHSSGWRIAFGRCGRKGRRNGQAQYPEKPWWCWKQCLIGRQENNRTSSTPSDQQQSEPLTQGRTDGCVDCWHQIQTIFFELYRTQRWSSGLPRL